MKVWISCVGIVLLAIALPRRTTATHELVGEPPQFNTPQTVKVFTYETDVNGDRNNLVIPCEITNKSSVSFTWYRGDVEVSADMVNSNGDLFVPNITEGEYASRDGVEYHCIATRYIGMNNFSASVRSKTIIVYYAFFDGFEQTETRDQFVTVALNSDVAMECDVRPANPQPNIQWLENGSPLAEVTTANAVRFLEGGRYLYIASLDSAQLQSRFSCRVTNALGDRVMAAPTTYRLVDNITLSTLVEYKQIGNLTAFVGDTNFEFSYVGGAYTNDGQMDFNGTTVSPTFDGRVVNVLANIATEEMIDKEELGENALSMRVSYDRTVTRRGTVTVYQRPTITSSPEDNREILMTQNNLAYTCEYEGSPNPTIEWFFNGRPISAASAVGTVGNTLTIASPDVLNSGIYQCIVSSQFGQDERAWLIEIREPILPQVQQYNFTALDAFDDRDLGALFVRSNASTVVFPVEVVADPCPTIDWFFNGLPLTTSNSTFMFNNPCTASGGQSPYWTFTLEVELTTETSGNYTANLTNVVGSTLLPKAYFTVPEEVSITDFTLLNKPCLKEGTNVSLRCRISGFPRPTIRFEVNGTIITPGEGIYENFVVQEYYDQIAILNVNMTAEGRYTCIADSGVPEPVRSAPESFSFCTNPSIVTSDAMDNPVIGEDFFVTCTVAGIPQPTISWKFNGEILENSGNPEISVTPDGYTSRVEVTNAMEPFNGRYECIATNLAGNASQSFLIQLGGAGPLLSTAAIIGIAAGGVAVILFIAFFILLLVCVYSCAKKSSSGNYSANPAYMGNDYHDGRGNVDKDSDEEDGQPEAFNPQYESLPALAQRPSQPPSYKPTPSYPMGVDDMEMRKVPLPDADLYPGGGYMMQDNGSASYNRPVVDDFLSEDAQFV